MRCRWSGDLTDATDSQVGGDSESAEWRSHQTSNNRRHSRNRSNCEKRKYHSFPIRFSTKIRISFSAYLVHTRADGGTMERRPRRRRPTDSRHRTRVHRGVFSLRRERSTGDDVVRRMTHFARCTHFAPTLHPLCTPLCTHFAGRAGRHHGPQLCTLTKTTSIMAKNSFACR